MNIGLVIQGPLISIGRSGSQLHETPTQLARSGELARFDCRQNIQRLIDDFGHLFNAIIISTRVDHLKPGDQWRGAILIAEADIGAEPMDSSYKDNNKFRQFRTTLAGLEELERRGMKYAIKVRTDQYLDLKRLLESYSKEMKKIGNPKAIFAPAVNRATFLLHDLYFSGELQVMKEFCESILAYDRFEFMPSVHRDMVLKHAYIHYRDKINVPDWAYFPVWPASGANRETKKIFSYMFDNVFFQLDEDVFRSVIWRGAHYAEDYTSVLFQQKRPARYDIPALMSTDWDRYSAFRTMTLKERSSFINPINVKIGRLGWKIWHQIRKIGRLLRTER